MVLLSLAVSTSSNLGLPIAMSRSRLGLELVLEVFLRMEYNRNSRFNFVGKAIPLISSMHSQADSYSDSSVGTRHSLLQLQAVRILRMP